MSQLLDLTSMTTDGVCSFLASQIRAERIKQGYTQKSMSEKSGIALRTYKRIESGGAGSIQNLIAILRTLERIAAIQKLLPPPNPEPRLSIIERVNAIANDRRTR